MKETHYESKVLGSIEQVESKKPAQYSNALHLRQKIVSLIRNILQDTTETCPRWIVWSQLYFNIGTVLIRPISRFEPTIATILMHQLHTLI